MSKDYPGFAVCVAYVPSSQYFSSTIVDMEVVGRRGQHGVLCRPIKIEGKSGGPEHVQRVALARVIRFWPMEVKDITVLSS